MMMPTRPLFSRSHRGQSEPVLARQTDIEHDERRQFALDEPAQGGAVAEGANAKILPREIVGEHLALHHLVFDDDDVGP
jgi:hypothetical protein